MNWILINFCALCVLLSSDKLFAQNNLTIIDSLLVEITEEVLEGSNTELKKNVIIKIGKFDRNLTGYLRTKISNVLSENNNTVFRNFPKDSSFESTVLEVLESNVIINYSEPFSENIFDETLATRTILFSIEGQVYNYVDKKVIYPISTEKLVTDKIKFNEIAIMEESPYEFTSGTKSGISYWQKILEPGIVVTSVLTVLLLLFTQRS